MTHMIQLNPDDLSLKEKYKLLIGMIVPRPIAFVSTLSKEGLANLAPFSFFNGVSSEPPCLVISTTYRGTDGQKKDTALNIEETGEFVVNVVTEDIVRQMNQASAEYPRDVNEFRETGLTEAPSIRVKAPRVAESPVSMECVLYKTVTVGNPGPGGSIMIIGRIVYYHVRDDVYDNGHILTERLKPVARLAGTQYCPVREIFSLERPVVQPASSSYQDA